MEPDPLLEKRIQRRIAWDREFELLRIAVEMNDVVVDLIGTVSSIAESHGARRIANEVSGVVGVVNGMTIDPDASGRMPAPYGSFPPEVVDMNQLRSLFGCLCDIACDPKITKCDP